MDNLEDQRLLREYFNEFLLVDIDPTDAALSAINVLSPRNNSKPNEDAQKALQKLQIQTESLLDEDYLFAGERNSVKHISMHYLPKIVEYFGNFYALNKSFMLSGVFEEIEEESCQVDFAKLSRFYTLIRDISKQYSDVSFVADIFYEITKVCESIQMKMTGIEKPIQIRFLPILLECPLFEDSVDFTALIELVRTVNHLNEFCKDILLKWYIDMPVANIRQQIANVQQMLTLNILEAQAENGVHALRDRLAHTIRHALGFMKIVYDANTIREERGLQSLNYREFNNDAINSIPELIEHDFNQWLNNEINSDFALLSHNFILDSANKALLLKCHASREQATQAHNVIYSTLLFGNRMDLNPFLILKVRRDAIIQNTLEQLSERVKNPGCLKKGLKIKFDGEEGVDEGGVQKEFFQLLIQELFNPDYGMFLRTDDSCFFWFNRYSFENKSEFELIGIILGLAIYNGVILNLNFPLAVYKKLLDIPCNMNDLREFQPELAKSMESILEMSEAGIASMDLTFSISVEAFGEVLEEALGDHSKDECVTIENRLEFVNLFIDWHLNKSIAEQFAAFYHGFRLCFENSLLSIFRAENLQLVICGSTELDFEALEAVTHYQDGFSKDSTTIRSDRIPIKGLSSMPFIIGRRGPDCNTLPTAHTCFNFLLLPDYRDKKKLQRLLGIALQNHQGFGLL
ncbi:putative E3 ubiquitin-protein ligase [Cardiosporidium cionae]|uniref:HECT-type E3 ubiquitin transferase n=1 Tax=Cardiosporidium cionae TaxID=476202 RepID=A0ABQ7JDP1_9APIC|nr:putative E3 ubiquitin-protein ligase [Cardiosporidium cionae]|eukprot:KAF8822143.1 putative E3 ubiquitin-protein ligase [Cardiosporidium cionae]